MGAAEQNPTAEAASAAPETAEQRFGWQHALSLLVAVAVSVLIYVLRDHIARFQELAYLGAFLVMLLGNATVILPVPGLTFVFAMGGSGALNPLLLGLAAGPGAALGEMTGYAAGYGGSAAIDNLALYRRLEAWMRRFGPVVISLLAAVPNPLFDMAGIVAGGLRMKWWRFLLAAWVGKTAQGVLVAYAGALSWEWVARLAGLH
jgi:membrane protein YqaA with SNARE-associated domain